MPLSASTCKSTPSQFQSLGGLLLPVTQRANHNGIGKKIRGDSKQHFTFSQPQNYLKFGPAYAKDTFAICPAVIYSQGVYVPTLVYRAPDAAKNSSCTDVKIKAIF